MTFSARPSEPVTQRRDQQHSDVLTLAQDLIRKPSITPADEGCQKLIASRLIPLGFEARWFYCGDVSNLLLTLGEGKPSLWFLGHTDVVTAGDERSWSHPPFAANVADGYLFGRGSSDMKGAVAAMVVAIETYARQHPDQRNGQLGLLLTSDEEGVAVDGIARVAAFLREAGPVPDCCLVGEPSSVEQLGDSVRVGRRGSIHGRLTVRGVQGHTAFPQYLDNPVHRVAPFLAQLVGKVWDEGSADFPPTSLQVAAIHAGSGANNVTPAEVTIQFNVRNCPASPSSQIRSAIDAMLLDSGVRDYELGWQVSGEPFFSVPGKLRAAVVAACRNILGTNPVLNTGGGTSDGRFIAPLGTEVLELGLINSTIHKVDERVAVDDLDRLSATYYDIIHRVLRA